MKVIISAQEAMDRGIWPQVMAMFGRNDDDEIGLREEFILSEEQAVELGLLRKQPSAQIEDNNINL